MPESAGARRHAARLAAAIAIFIACLTAASTSAFSQVPEPTGGEAGAADASGEDAEQSEEGTAGAESEQGGADGEQAADQPAQGADDEEPADVAAPEVEPSDPETEQPAGTSSGRGDGRVRLTLEKVGPTNAYFAAKRKVTFRYEFAGSRKRDLRIQAVTKGNQRPVRAWVREDVTPREEHKVRWNGAKRGGGPVGAGKYMFRVREVDGDFAERSKAKGLRIFNLRAHKFPVRGRHSYGDGFGAGRGHQGVDVFARCGTEMIAARAGKVQYRGYQSSAGNYTVIDGRGTKRDYVYMHLKRQAKFAEGRKVRVGDMIGRVGETGNATGCHLHFELWKSPGWYEGGKPTRRIKRVVKGWDRYS